MPNILTPLSLWESFDASLETSPETLSVEENDGTVIERVNFYGRKIGDDRVIIAAAYAYDKTAPQADTVIILPDSRDTIDVELLKLFVKRGFSALMVDYRGKWEGCDFYTRYPAEINYADFADCGRHYDFVDGSAAETSWYEWVAVGIYARKYALERSNNGKLAVVGIRDGGEVAWKLGVAANFNCIIPICAVGWKAYSGISKYHSVEPVLNDERYRYIAGIDSQAYAPYVKCPVLMLCATNDSSFDYDRAYDTFSRINPQFIGDSSIAYSVHWNGCIGQKSTADMFMFLDKNLKNRQVFIPRPAEVVIDMDEESNLVATAKFDESGIVEFCGMYYAEDCIESSLREWSECPPKSKITPKQQQFYLNVYEKTSTVFAFCYVKYMNGFTVWSKVVAKKVSGTFRNSMPKCRVLYSDKENVYAFTFADPLNAAVGKIFFTDGSSIPRVVEKNGVKGLYSKYGLTTYKLNSPVYSPSAGSILKLDIYCDATSGVQLVYTDGAGGEEYVYETEIIGEVWQSVIADCKLFKNAGGVPLASFASGVKLTIKSDSACAVNNVMWL